MHSKNQYQKISLSISRNLILSIIILIVSVGIACAQSSTYQLLNQDYSNSADKANSIVNTHYQSDSLKRIEKRVIVEFQGATLAEQYKHYADKQLLQQNIEQTMSMQTSIFSQFLTDLEKIEKEGFSHNGEKRAYFINAQTGRTYRITFFGQQVTLDSLMVKKIEALPYVKAVHPDKKVEAILDESVPQIGADSVWNELNCEGDSITIGIIDTGIDYLHPDLGGGFGPGYKVIGGYDFVNSDDDPMDDHDHGTHVAGIAAANGTLKGVAPGALLYALKVLNNQGSGYSSDIIAAIEYTVDPNGDSDFTDHLDVVNMSLGGTPTNDDPMVNAVEAAIDLGVTYCIAAGNDGPQTGSIGSPGTSPSAITVGAVDKNDTIADFSSRGPADFTYLPKPDIVAPGVDINSCVRNNNYELHSGTSMATPHITGASALLKKLHPEWGPSDIKSALMLTARDLNEHLLTQGAGIPNVYRAALVNTLVDKATLFFGINTLSYSESWTNKDSVTFTNHSAVPLEYTVESNESVPGVTLSFPGSFTLGPGEETTIDVEISVDNESLGEALRKGNGFYGNQLTVSNNDQSFKLDYLFIRKFFVNIDTVNLNNIYLFNNEYYYQGVFHSFIPTEILVNPGSYTLIAELFDKSEWGYPMSRYSIIQQIEMNENKTLSFSKTKAPHKIIFNTQDRNGNTYTSDLAKGRQILFYSPGNFMYMPYRYTNFSMGGYLQKSVYHWNDTISGITTSTYIPLDNEPEFRRMDTLYFSDLPENINIYIAEARRTETGGMDYCFSEKGPLVPETDPLLLSTQSTDYKTLYFRNNVPGKEFIFYPQLLYKIEGYEDISISYSSYTGDFIDGVFSVSMPPSLNPDRDLFYYFRMQQEVDFTTAPLRFIENQFVIGYNGSPGSVYIDEGDTLNLNNAPYSGTIQSEFNNSKFLLGILQNYKGLLNEKNWQINSISYLYNEQEEVIDSGSYAIYHDNIPGAYHSTFNINNDRKIYGLLAENTIDIWFDTRLEYPQPPCLHAFHVYNENGIPNNLIQKNGSASFVYTLNDGELTYSESFNLLPIPVDSIKVYAKNHYSDEWETLNVDSLGYNSLEGITCRSSFTSTNYDSAFIDVKIVASDESGNRTETVISPAFYIRNIQQPVAYNDNYEMVDETGYYYTEYSILENDENPFGKIDQLSIEYLSEPSNGLLILDTAGYFYYHPNTDYYGTDQFSYRVKNELYTSEPAIIYLEVKPTGLQEFISPESDNIRIYPNPASDRVNISLNLTQNTEVHISAFDITGTKLADIFSESLNEGEHIVHWDLNKNRTNEILSGIYFITIQTNKINEIIKVIIK